MPIALPPSAPPSFHLSYSSYTSETSPISYSSVSWHVREILVLGEIKHLGPIKDKLPRCHCAFRSQKISASLVCRHHLRSHLCPQFPLFKSIHTQAEQWLAVYTAGWREQQSIVSISVCEWGGHCREWLHRGIQHSVLAWTSPVNKC